MSVRKGISLGKLLKWVKAGVKLFGYGFAFVES